ncbi:NAD(P)/FAD-dependent oxidoreductase [Pollutibacter soli]|uniref:NAD(P)/FAD-dependent oxidoreductase n=1 Tax=Pollutibacter soli TaxID=3034157 RepID=UPI003013AE8F
MKKAIIVGAGPAGLTAAYELLLHTDIVPIILEAESQVGGLSKTIDYKGNKIDIGGHRFFSKSDRVLQWWLNFLPLESDVQNGINIRYQNQNKTFAIAHKIGNSEDDVMLLRARKSRIYFEHKFFDYPLRLNFPTVKKLGAVKMTKIAATYLKARLAPESKEENLAQFYRNRFGSELYKTFFRDYTQKVWGVSCEQIPASWGKQRVKDLDISKLMKHALKSFFSSPKSIQQKDTSTSLIEQFLYPRYGPGQLWEKVANEITSRGGTILLNTVSKKINGNTDGLQSLEAIDLKTNNHFKIEADYFFSTMPVKQLISQLNFEVPENVKQVSAALEYRDFIIVGVLAESLKVKDNEAGNELITDNWIYIQDRGIQAGRIQVFNNWSPHMVQHAGDIWLGVEYFCSEKDALWNQSDSEITAMAIREMESIGILQGNQVKDLMVARIKKAYPSYYGSYSRFNEIQTFTDSIPNLFLIGRNGMHRYNNSDHSMLTAMTAVENIISRRADKKNIWEVNTEDDYHEEK